MFFRNLSLFRFSADTARTLDDLETTLDGQRLRPCGAMELFTRGFVSPLGGEDKALTRTLGEHTLLTLGQEDKILPAAVVAAETSQRAKALAESEGEAVSARRRRGIKQEVIEELLPRAFSKPSQTSAWLDRKAGWVVVDTSSSKKAEALLSSLRDALGTFAVQPPVPSHPVRDRLTHWLTSGDLPAGLALAEECELRDPGTGGAVVRCRHQNLTADEIGEHLRSGKQVFHLGLHFDDRMSFVLGEDLVIRKLSFHDVVLEELDFETGADAAAEVDARFVLMTGEVSRLLEQMVDWFGLSRPEAG